jgi:small subunit ribosomal protein S15
MARMHARRKGSSGSTQVLYDKKPDWVPLKEKELEELIVSLHKEGNSTSQIGIILRDLHGVPGTKIAIGKNITKILAENGLTPKLPEDLEALLKRSVRMHTHMKENHKDLHNKRQLHLIEAKIRRLVKYYQKRGILPATWKYTADSAKLLVE